MDSQRSNATFQTAAPTRNPTLSISTAVGWPGNRATVTSSQSGESGSHDDHAQPGQHSTWSCAAGGPGHGDAHALRQAHAHQGTVRLGTRYHRGSFPPRRSRNPVFPTRPDDVCLRRATAAHIAAAHANTPSSLTVHLFPLTRKTRVPMENQQQGRVWKGRGPGLGDRCAQARGVRAPLPCLETRSVPSYRASERVSWFHAVPDACRCRGILPLG